VKLSANYKTLRSIGWTRINFCDGSGRYYIVPPKDSAEPVRVYEFLSAGSWSNLDGDDRAYQFIDRAVLVEGPPVPPAVAAWLTDRVMAEGDTARERLRAAIDDADNAPFRTEGW